MTNEQPKQIFSSLNVKRLNNNNYQFLPQAKLSNVVIEKTVVIHDFQI
jgi:hypothetical protein